MARSYHGSCHCKMFQFELTTETIQTGVRCNCSTCVRRGAVMSDPYYPPEAFVRLDGVASLAIYQWGDHDVRFYFCPTCGVYTFHELTAKPGHLRINVGCIEGIDPLALAIRLVDGRSF